MTVEPKHVDLNSGQANSGQANDLEQLCRLAIDKLDGRYRKGRVVLMMSGRPQPLDINEELLGAVLKHVLENALQYSDDSSIVRLCLLWQEWGVSLQIHDEGIGISEDDIDFVFAPGYRGTNVRDLPGQGMGLSVVKQALDDLKLEVDVCSVESIGTSLIVAIPCPRSAIVTAPSTRQALVTV